LSLLDYAVNTLLPYGKTSLRFTFFQKTEAVERYAKNSLQS